MNLPHGTKIQYKSKEVSKDIYLGSILHSFAFCNYLIFLCSRVINLCDLGAHVGADALPLCP